jgi:hypothetical protein
MPAMRDDMLGVVVEGAADRFFGRPLDKNPYCEENAGEAWRVWALGWKEADWLMDARGAEEASRWLRGGV